MCLSTLIGFLTPLYPKTGITPPAHHRFGIHGVVNGEALCPMFRQAIQGVTTFASLPHVNENGNKPTTPLS
jgi:hypothetical protein